MDVTLGPNGEGPAHTWDDCGRILVVGGRKVRGALIDDDQIAVAHAPGDVYRQPPLGPGEKYTITGFDLCPRCRGRSAAALARVARDFGLTVERARYALDLARMLPDLGTPIDVLGQAGVPRMVPAPERYPARYTELNPDGTFGVPIGVVPTKADLERYQEAIRKGPPPETPLWKCLCGGHHRLGEQCPELGIYGPGYVEAFADLGLNPDLTIADVAPSEPDSWVEVVRADTFASLSSTEGKRRYPPHGTTPGEDGEILVCTCAPSCPKPCNGRGCGCEACGKE
jgi:hypothetical protein